MSRLLFLIIIVAFVYWLLKSYSKQLSQTDEPSPPPVEDMVRCVHCGVHLPKHEGILADNKYYCSEAHRREYDDKP